MFAQGLLSEGSGTTQASRGARWVVTGRGGGVSQGPYAALNLAGHVGDDPGAVHVNRQRAAAMLGVSAESLAVMHACHGADVAVVERGGEIGGVDGLVTATAEVGLAALAADCVPIALADPDAGVIAAVHCGWKGLGAGVVAATVDTMTRLGASRIRAVVGPHVCARCYPVGVERVEALQAEVSELVADQACVHMDGQWLIDVGGGVGAQLTALGIEFSSVGGCTAESPELFSYRRDRVTGRHGMMIALPA